MATVEQFPSRLPLTPQTPEPAYRVPPPTSRRSRRCSARFSSTTTPMTASPISCEPSILSRRSIAASIEIAGSLIRAGKLASPITLKTFLGEHDLGGRHRAAISRAARRRSDDDHQRQRLRALDPRPRDPARADPASARTSSTSPTTRRSIPRRANRSRRRRSASIRSPTAAATAAASRAFPTR